MLVGRSMLDDHLLRDFVMLISSCLFLNQFCCSGDNETIIIRGDIDFAVVKSLGVGAKETLRQIFDLQR